MTLFVFLQASDTMYVTLFPVPLICLFATSGALSSGTDLTIDSLTVRLLSSKVVQDELSLTGSEAIQLVAIRDEYEQQVRLLTARIEGAAAESEERSLLVSDVESIKKRTKRALGMAIGTERVTRLQQLRWHCLGLSSAFVDQNQSTLRITESQGRQFRSACVTVRRKEFEDFVRYQTASSSDKLARLEANHWKMVNVLDQQIQSILTEDQRQSLAEIMGNPPAAPIRLFDAKAQLRSYSSRLADIRSRQSPAQSLAQLVVNPVVKRLLGVDGTEAERLDAILSSKRIKDRDSPKSPPDRAVHDSTSQEIREVLGDDRWTRLQQIQLQVRGLGIVFGHEWRKEFNVSDEQFREMNRVATEIMTAEASVLDVPGGAIGSVQPGSRIRHELNDRLFSVVLTEDQRTIWNQKVGPVIDPDVLDAIHRSAYARVGANVPHENRAASVRDCDTDFDIAKVTPYR